MRCIPQLLLCSFLALSCGEIELPQSTGNTEQPAEEGDDKERPTDTTGDENAPGDNTPGNGNDTTGGTPGDGNGTTGDDAQTPQDIVIGRVCLTADNHIIVDNRLYLSAGEFWYVSSASGSEPKAAQKLATDYTEGELRKWRIPTDNDVELLRDALACESPYYGKGTLPKLNQALESRELNGIYRERYLCSDAAYTFDFLLDTNVAKASKNATYRLRLVRDK